MLHKIVTEYNRYPYTKEYMCIVFVNPYNRRVKHMDEVYLIHVQFHTQHPYT